MNSMFQHDKEKSYEKKPDDDHVDIYMKIKLFFSVFLYNSARLYLFYLITILESTSHIIKVTINSSVLKSIIKFNYIEHVEASKK